MTLFMQIFSLYIAFFTPYKRADFDCETSRRSPEYTAGKRRGEKENMDKFFVLSVSISFVTAFKLIEYVIKFYSLLPVRLFWYDKLCLLPN